MSGGSDDVEQREPASHPDDVIVRMSPFGPDKHDKVIARARKDERDAQDGVLALSVFSAPHDLTPEQFTAFLRAIPVGGTRMYLARREELLAAGYELRWDWITNSDRHYLLPIGVVSDTHSELEAMLDTLEMVFGDPVRNPSHKS